MSAERGLGSNPIWAHSEVAKSVVARLPGLESSSIFLWDLRAISFSSGLSFLIFKEARLTEPSGRAVVRTE